MVWNNDQVSGLETKRIIDIARGCLCKEGDFVEFGCYKGDTSLVLAELLVGTGKKLWIYDSFEGLPEKSGQDESEIGKNFRAGELKATKRDVKLRFLKAGLPVPVIKKGWFCDLKNEDLPTKIVFAFLDGDFYDSIRESLDWVTPRMIEGGVILIHDYNNPALPGVARALNEWMSVKNIRFERYQSLGIVEM